MAALPTDALGPDALRLRDELAAERGTVDGMYLTLLNHPELTRHVSNLGTYLRFGATLPGDVRELVILWVATQLRAGYEWVKHVPPAKQAGLSEDTIEDLRAGRTPDGLSPAQLEALQVAAFVFAGHSIPDRVQQAAIEHVGVDGVLELVILVGFYRMIAGVLSSFDVAMPAGTTDPFPHPEH